MTPSSCAPLTAQIRTFGTRLVWQSSLGHWFWGVGALGILGRVGSPELALDEYWPPDPCSPREESSGCPTELSPHTIVTFSCSGDSPGRREGLSRRGADGVNSLALPSWSKEEKGSPGRFVQQGCDPGRAAHRVRRFAHPCLAVGARGVTWCL